MKKASLLFVLSLLAACESPDGSPVPTSPPSAGSPSFASPTGTASASPTPPALPERPRPTSAPPTVACIQGWTTPELGTRLATVPIRIIRRTVRLAGRPTIVDLRYFTGPESPPSIKGYLHTVERWYVKLFTEEDLSFQGRFLVERREFGSGVAAVAPYDTDGFRSPDWSGFQWDGGDPERRAYPGLPGRWAGVRFDFVRGGAGLGVPGLPREVRGCFDGT